MLHVTCTSQACDSIDCTACFVVLFLLIGLFFVYFYVIGYFCLTGARSATPSQGQDANECPNGFYCPIGSAQPLSCPPGEYITTFTCSTEETFFQSCFLGTSCSC